MLLELRGVSSLPFVPFRCGSAQLTYWLHWPFRKLCSRCGHTKLLARGQCLLADTACDAASGRFPRPVSCTLCLLPGSAFYCGGEAGYFAGEPVGISHHDLRFQVRLYLFCLIPDEHTGFAPHGSNEVGVSGPRFVVSCSEVSRSRVRLVACVCDRCRRRKTTSLGDGDVDSSPSPSPSLQSQSPAYEAPLSPVFVFAAPAPSQSSCGPGVAVLIVMLGVACYVGISYDSSSAKSQPNDERPLHQSTTAAYLALTPAMAPVLRVAPGCLPTPSPPRCKAST